MGFDRNCLQEIESKMCIRNVSCVFTPNKRIRTIMATQGRHLSDRDRTRQPIWEELTKVKKGDVSRPISHLGGDCRIHRLHSCRGERFPNKFPDMTLNHPRPVSWGCRMHQLRLCRGVRHPRNQRPAYDNKQSDVEARVMLEVWRKWSTLSFP